MLLLGACICWLGIAKSKNVAGQGVGHKCGAAMHSGGRRRDLGSLAFIMVNLQVV